MSVRSATRRWHDLGDFLRDWNGTLKSGAVYLPAGSVDGELAPEVRLDLMLPVLGRVGPVRAQVVHRSPDGGVALQLPDLEAEAGPQIQELLGIVQTLRDYLVETGEVVLRADVDALRAELDEARTAPPPVAVGSAPASAPAPVGAAEPAAAARPAGRGVAVPDVAAIEPDLQGSMSDRSLQDASLRLAAERWTGLITVKLDDGRVRYGFWNKGGPVGFRTDPVQEDEVLGILLFKAGQIDKEQLAASLTRMERTGQRQGEAFIDMGLMTFSQLIMVLGKQTEFVFMRMLAETGGTWTFHQLESLPEQFLPPPVRVPSLVYRSMVTRARAMPAANLAGAHRENIDQYIHFNEALIPLLADIKFDASERKLLGILRGNTWRMREAFTVSPISRQATACVLWAFMEMGFLDFERKEDRERYLRRITEHVARKSRQLNNCTHFDVLEIHWISLPDEIRAGFQRLCDEYDPGEYEALPEALVRSMAYIRERMDESYALLSDDEKRRAYRKELLEPMMIMQSAELLSKKGEMAIMRKDRRAALTCFSKALELQPGHPSYRDGLQRARTAT